MTKKYLKFVENTLNNTDILLAVNDWVRPRRKGNVWVSRCPICAAEKGFSVNRERLFFNCSSCGEGGDIFRFLQKMEDFNFQRAVEMAERLYLRA